MASGTINDRLLISEQLNVSYGTSLTNMVSGNPQIFAYRIGKIVFVGGYISTTSAWTSTLTDIFTGLPAPANNNARFISMVGEGLSVPIYYNAGSWKVSASQGKKALNFAFTYFTA